VTSASSMEADRSEKARGTMPTGTFPGSQTAP
jgi:hypothetical protein